MANPGGMSGGLAGDRSSQDFPPVPKQWESSMPDPGKQQTMPQPVQRQPRMNLTKEEMQALQECSRESFYYRCVPLSILFMGSTQILVNKGMLRPHPRLGALPKNMFAGLIGYLVGKVSYQGECRRKIMALPNSPLGEAMRSGKKGRELMEGMSVSPSGIGRSGTEAEPAFVEPTAPLLSDNYIDSAQGSGLDDTKRPSVDSVQEPAKQESAPSFTTYDELRKRNRAEHESRSSPSNAAPLYEKPLPKPSYSNPPPPRVRTNKYGDVIEE